MDYTARLVYQSNYWYNDGLEKAKIRDLSGAITSLRRSLQYNRGNIAAMNLLGLVYYGRGDVVEALVEWILSKNFQSHDNIANYYIGKVQETPGELAEINQAVKRYNQSLQYAAQHGEDLAIIQLKKAVMSHPTYVKAYQLLAFLYLHTEQYGNARQMLRIAQRLDTTDERTLRYMHELNEIRRERPVTVKKTEKKDPQTVTYSIGNETIIQPVSASYKENTGLHTVVNIGIGVLVGVLVMWFLIMPAMNASRQGKINKQTLAFSDQIAEQDSQISALQKELDKYRSTSEAAENAQATAESTKAGYETVLDIEKHYRAQDMSNEAMMKELLEVVPGALGTAGREKYDTITGRLFPVMCQRLYETSQKNFEVANYDYAIDNLNTVLKMDKDYRDGAAMLLLAQTYEKKGEQDKANLRYQKIIEEHPDTDAAAKAQEALDAQKSGEKQDGPTGDSVPADGDAKPQTSPESGGTEE